MNGELVTDLTTLVCEMRSVSLQNRNLDILPSPHGAAVMMMSKTHRRSSLSCSHKEENNLRREKLGSARWACSVIPRRAGRRGRAGGGTRRPPFLLYLNGGVLILWPFLTVRSPNSQLAGLSTSFPLQPCLLLAFLAQQMRPRGIAICRAVFRPCLRQLPTAYYTRGLVAPRCKLVTHTCQTRRNCHTCCTLTHHTCHVGCPSLVGPAGKGWEGCCTNQWHIDHCTCSPVLLVVGHL